jgi:cell division control protein 6
LGSPARVLFRDVEVGLVRDAVLHRVNVLVVGCRGCGRTVTVLHAVSGFRHVYVDLEHYDTPLRFLQYLSLSVGVSASGNTVRLLHRVAWGLVEGGFEALVLDNAGVARRWVWAGGYAVLCELARMLKGRVSVVAVIGDRELEPLGGRLAGCLEGVVVRLKPYTPEQVAAIALSWLEQLGLRHLVDPEAVWEAVRASGSNPKLALELLRVSGELANNGRVTVEHVRRATRELEEARILEGVGALPPSARLVLAVLMDLGRATTGEIHREYNRRAEHYGLKPLTLRRISAIIGELAEMGLVEAKVVSYGRRGRTKVVELRVNKDVLGRALSELL